MTLLSGLPEVIDDSEQVARFLTQRSHIAIGIVTAAAVLPNPKDRETAVIRAINLSRVEMWPHGLLAAGQRTLYGAVLLKACAARAALLQVEASEPPERHAVITGWFWSDADKPLQKARQKETALLLAQAAGPPEIAPTL